MAFIFCAFITLYVVISFIGLEAISLINKDKYLPDHVFLKFNVSESGWLSCTRACTQDTRCISYHFETRANICELNDHGVTTACLADKILIDRPGTIFHQIRVS